jgi:hypothetical protein
MFFLLLLRFALDAEGRDRPGFETLKRDFLPTAFAYTVAPRSQAIEGFVDLLDQLPFPVFDP